VDATTVLVVDGQTLVRHALARVLTEAGFAVVAAGDGPAVLAALEEQPIDAVVADVSMAHTGGFDVVAAVRALGEAIPVVLMTDGSHDLSGFDVPVLIKPFDVGELLARLPRRTHIANEDRLVQEIPV
jgi:DNA-binding response OmpR family regulator